VSPYEINNAGGILQYWERLAKTRPRLARMALDFLTAPGRFTISRDSPVGLLYC